MAGSPIGNAGVYKWGAVAGSGVNREDLLDQITNVDPWDTPWVTQAPKVGANHIYHEWLKDTLGTVDSLGAVEGADYSFESSTTPTREFNITMILRQDIGVTETQRYLNPAGFKDAYAYEIQKATKRMAIKLEKAVFTALSSSTGNSGSARQMKNFQDFITSNSAFAGAETLTNSGDATHAGQLDSKDFNAMLQRIYVAGGNPEQVYASPAVKRIISAFTVTQQNRNIAAVDRKLVSAIDFYDSDFGLIQIVLDRWVPESTGTTTATSNADASGRLFFLQRSMNRLAWLRPMQHYLVGKRGDSVAGIVVGEVTLEVLNEKANGVIKSVNNKSTLV
jgi:hypothetical protein